MSQERPWLLFSCQVGGQVGAGSRRESASSFILWELHLRPCGDSAGLLQLRPAHLLAKRPAPLPPPSDSAPLLTFLFTWKFCLSLAIRLGFNFSPNPGPLQGDVSLPCSEPTQDSFSAILCCHLSVSPPVLSLPLNHKLHPGEAHTTSLYATCIDPHSGHHSQWAPWGCGLTTTQSFPVHSESKPNSLP